MAKPIVGGLLLPSIHDGLLEHAVLVAQAIASSGELHGGHRIEETCRQPAEAAVTQARIGFLLEQLQPVDVFILNHLLRDRIEHEVGNVVGQRTANEKLEREVVDALGILLFVGSLGLHPALREDIPYGMGERLKAFPCAGHLRVDRAVKNQMAVVESAVCSIKWNRAGPILPREFGGRWLNWLSSERLWRSLGGAYFLCSFGNPRRLGCSQSI